MATVLFKWITIPISNLLKHFMFVLYTLQMLLVSMVVKTKAVMLRMSINNTASLDNLFIGVS